MTITQLAPSSLSFDMADRMKKAIRASDVSVTDISDTLEVSRNAVSSWINGRHEPRSRDLRAFAEMTGVTVQWLQTGIDMEASIREPEAAIREIEKATGMTLGDLIKLEQELCARRDLNPRPIDP